MEERKARNNQRQREAAAASRAETRQRLITSAAAEFVAVGYVAATVNKIAARAGVSVQTLYLACGSKRELLREFMTRSLAPAGGDPRTHFLAEMAPASPAEHLRRIAAIYRRACERSAAAWKVYRDGAAVDPVIAADWQQLQELRRGTFEALLSALPDSALKVDRTVAIDTTWAIASPDMYDLMVRQRCYTLDQFENWLATTLHAAILTA
jgi:AcrR family transcriptional regulator